jgi:hypothetical protein
MCRRLGLKEALRRDDVHADGHGSDAAAGWRTALARAGRRLLSPAAWPLAAKLVVAMLVSALVPMLVTGLYNLRGAQQALTEDASCARAS